MVTEHQAGHCHPLWIKRLLGAQIGAMIHCAVVAAGHADLVVQEVAVMVQAGFATEAAKLVRQNLLMGNQVPHASWASNFPVKRDG